MRLSTSTAITWWWRNKVSPAAAERGRDLLGARLVRRGLGPAAVVVATAWPSATVSACLPATLVSSTIKAAGLFAAGPAVAASVISVKVAALTEGVLKTMLFTKLRVATAMAFVCVLVFGAGSLVLRAQEGKKDAPAAKEAKIDDDKLKGDARPAAGAGKPRVVDVGAAVAALAWSPDGKFVATQVIEWSPTRDGDSLRTGRALQIRDAETGAVRRTLYDKNNVCDARFSPDGKSVAAALAGENVVKLWDPATGKEQRTFKGVNIANASLTNIAFSRDGRLLAAAGRVKLAADQESNGAVILWETGSGKLLWQVRGHTSVQWERGLAFSPDGKLLATGAGGTIKLWDTATGKCEQTLRAHEEQGPVWSLAFSPDGKLLASGGLDGTVRLWDPDSGKLTQFLTSGYVMGLHLPVAFSPDGRWLAVGGTTLGSTAEGRGDVRVFDAKTWKLHKAFPDMLGPGVRALAFSPSGETLAVGNWNKQLLLVPTQK